MMRMLHLFNAFYLLLLLSDTVNTVAVMSVDLGSEWMKVAIVSPGVPMEIALNKESKRKTPMAIAFRNGERTFGEDALSVGIRFPANCYTYITDLVGKSVDNPLVKLYQKRFPYYNIIPDPVRGTVLFKHDDDTVYSPEELLGMMLHKAKEFAEESAGQSITEAVLTVPGYFNQAERKAVLKAGELSGLKVLQLMNDHSAAALSYGIFRRKDFNETAQYIMLYDMGAFSTSVSIASFQVVKTKEKGYIESDPQLSIIGVGYDRTLGGVEMQLRLRDYLAKKFNDMKKSKEDVFKNPRALAKLYKEAGRLKQILSANADHYAQVEGLVDEIDFKLQVTREDFENLCLDLFDRVKNPVEQALKLSGLSIDIINQVILVGAGTRVPAVQQALSNVMKIELSKSLNTDESIVLGAAYKAADLSKGFKVKKFITKDAVLFPIQVQFEKEGDKESKPVKRTLFGLMNPFPQKKMLTFNKHRNDFSFLVHYGEVDVWPDHEVKFLGPTLLHNVTLIGVSDAIKKHKGSNVESKGIKVHFTMDESGILSITNVEYVVEKTLTAEELAEKENPQSTFSKISSTISKLFQAAEEELKEEGEKLVHEEKKEDEDQREMDKDDVKEKKLSNGTETESEIKSPVDDKKETDNKKADIGDKNEDANGNKQGNDFSEKFPKNATTTSKEPVNKPVIIKENISLREEHLGILLPTPEQITESLNKIKKLNENDAIKKRREMALNALESAIIDIRLEGDNEILSFANELEAQSIRAKTDEISNWFDEEGFSSSAEVLETKLEELQNILKPVKYRYKEYKERPELITGLNKALNQSSHFLLSVKNLTSILNQTDESGIPVSPYTPIELETLEKLISSTEEWKDNMIKKQEALSKSENPVLSSTLIREKFATLDREVRYLVNKSRNWRPPPKKEETSDNESKSQEKKDKPKFKRKKSKTPENETESVDKKMDITEDALELESSESEPPQNDGVSSEMPTKTPEDEPEDSHAEL